MVDFKKKLADLRAKNALEERLKKVQSQSGPSMVPSYKKKKEEEPPPPDLRELDLDPADRTKLAQITMQHAALTRQMSAIKKEKDSLTKDAKEICNNYGLTAYTADGERGAYYKILKSKISKELLLAHNVSAKVIAACTITKEVWAYKTTGKGQEDDDADNDM